MVHKYPWAPSRYQSGLPGTVPLRSRFGDQGWASTGVLCSQQCSPCRGLPLGKLGCLSHCDTEHEAEPRGLHLTQKVKRNEAETNQGLCSMGRLSTKARTCTEDPVLWLLDLLMVPSRGTFNSWALVTPRWGAMTTTPTMGVFTGH